MKVKDFRELRKNTLRGFFTMEIAGSIEIRDCSLHHLNGRSWFAFPGAAQIDKDGQVRRENGKVLYKNVVAIPDQKMAQRVQAEVVEALREYLDA
jgi:hypothetical protein